MGLVSGDIILLQHRGQCFGQQIRVNRTLVVQGNFPAITRVVDDLATIANAVTVGADNDQTSVYLDVLPPQYSLNSIRVQKLNVPRSVAFDLSTPMTTGNNMASATVANDAAALTFRTELAGRNQVSTLKIGPIPDGFSASGLLNPIAFGLMNLLGNAWRANIPVAGTTSVLFPVILHRSSFTWDVINSHVIGSQSRTQRRRTVGLGE